MKPLKNKWLLLMLLTLSLSSLIATKVQADTSGTLKINDQVIYGEHGQVGDQTDSTYTDPELFLSSKNKIEAKRQQRQANVVKKAHQDNFIKKVPTKKNQLEQKANAKLFRKKDQTVTNLDHNSTDQQQANVKKIGTYVAVAIAGLITVVLGIVLGKKFSYHRQSKKVKR